MIDTLHHVSTPEGVELDLRTAGVYVRAEACLIDVLIRYSLLFVLAALLGRTLGEAGIGLVLLLVFFSEWLYPVVFEVLAGGATPGKRVLGIVVVNFDGTPVGWGASLLRNLLRFVDFFPVAYLIGLIAMVANRDARRLGDLAAGTLVVYRDPHERAPRLPKAEPVLPRVALHQHEQRAVIEFAERLDDLARKRQEELAGLLEPLTGEGGRAGVARIVGIATHLVEKP
ncbi:MAG: RDD family protein [Planctomycetes bacterium]|nr:RDD family protein [Planctomycetota bacterium]